MDKEEKSSKDVIASLCERLADMTNLTKEASDDDESCCQVYTCVTLPVPEDVQEDL